MTYSIRPATSDDIADVTKIESYSNRPAWSSESFSQEIEKKFSHFWVLTDDETDSKIAGYMVFSLPGEQAHLQTLAVSREFRGQGMAKKLVRALVAYVSRKKGDSIVLEVRKSNTPAIKLYQSLGFVVLHQIKQAYPDGEGGYSMIYKVERNKLTGDPIVDFETDDNENKNLN